MPEGIAELCLSFRFSKQPPIGVSLIADRPEALKMLAAFALHPLPRWIRPKSKMPEDGRERWLWLWSGYRGGPNEPDFLDELAVVAGISVETAFRVWPSLMASRVIFPDGTMSEEGQTLLQAKLVRSLPKPPPSAPTKKREQNG